MAESKYYGIYQGVVCNLKDPEKRGRIKTIIPSVLGDSIESAWCEPCVNVAYDDGGDICLPPIDELVWIMFIEGDPNRPVWLGSWWSKNKTNFGDTDYYKKYTTQRIIEYGGHKVTMDKKNNIVKIENNKGASVEMKNKIITISNGDGAVIKLEGKNIYLN